MISWKQNRIDEGDLNIRQNDAIKNFASGTGCALCLKSECNVFVYGIVTIVFIVYFDTVNAFPVISVVLVRILPFICIHFFLTKILFGSLQSMELPWTAILMSKGDWASIAPNGSRRTPCWLIKGIVNCMFTSALLPLTILNVGVNTLNEYNLSNIF